jgi:hypothetical protein
VDGDAAGCVSVTDTIQLNSTSKSYETINHLVFCVEPDELLKLTWRAQPGYRLARKASIPACATASS